MIGALRPLDAGINSTFVLMIVHKVDNGRVGQEGDG